MQGYCHNCAAVLRSESVVCPYCGYDSSKYFPAPHQLLPETELAGRYRVGRVLGNGGFGITYVGADTVLDRKVAIKEFYMTGFVSRDILRSAEVQITDGSYGEDFVRNRDRFLSEAKVLARFASEAGIVTVHDFFTANNTAYIIMEYLDGETLAAYLKRSGLLSWQETFTLLRPVMQCLSRVHRHDIIHRDISPDNIMLTEHGQVKLLDFGAARDYADGGHSLSVILKRGYAPMEQNSRNRNMQGPWTDVYALCATVYRCLTGKVPEDAMDRINGDDVKPPYELGCCSRPISDVLMKGLALRRKDRWQSMDELLAALEQADRMGYDQPFFAAAKPETDEEATVYVGATPASQPVSQLPKTEPKPAEPEKSVPQPSKPTEAQHDIPSSQKKGLPMKKRAGRFLVMIAAVVAAIALVVSFVILPAIRNNEADEPMGADKSEEAIVSSDVLDGKYKDAVALMEAKKYSEAIIAFESLDGYKDSVTKITECNTAILDGKYNDAVALMASEKYSEAIDAFETLADYKDSADKIIECNYYIALTLMETKQYTEAIDAFVLLDGYKDSTTKIEECETAIINEEYDNAVALLDSGEIIAAYEAFVALNGYKDSAEMVHSIYENYKSEILENLKVGDSIFFGSYEQDNNISNGKENIEWLVLNATPSKALVISKYALDCKPFNTTPAKVTWETCSLRQWLNSDFMNEAFNAEERTMISTAKVYADKNPTYSSIDPGKDTQDHVFLLSITEFDKYFSSYEAGNCLPTTFSVANGVAADTSGYGACNWWLRSPGFSSYHAACISPLGPYSSIAPMGESVDCAGIAVRPAMWIDLSSLP